MWTGPFRRQAARLGVNVAGSEAYDADAKDYRALADRVARSGADGVLIGGSVWLGRRSSPDGAARPTGISGDHHGRPPVRRGSRRARQRGRASHGLYVAAGNLPSLALHLTPAAERFIDDAGAAANVALRPADGSGHRNRPARDRSFRRHSPLGPTPAPSDPRHARHPRPLPLRPQRRHHPRQRHDRPCHRQNRARTDAARRARRSSQSRAPRPYPRATQDDRADTISPLRPRLRLHTQTHSRTDTKPPQIAPVHDTGVQVAREARALTGFCAGPAAGRTRRRRAPRWRVLSRRASLAGPAPW